MTFEDLFSPLFWSGHTKRLGVNDVIRVREAGGAFDCELTVVATMQAGVVVELLQPRSFAQHLAVQEAADKLRPAVAEGV